MPAPSGGFDILFKQAKIADGMGTKIFQADLGVRGDRIEELGDIPEAQAHRVIPCHGFILAPGFVDMHGHSDYHLLVRPEADSKILQGVTTEITGNCGYSAAPVRGQLAKERAESYKSIFNLDLEFQSLEEYLEQLESLKPAINVAPLVGYNTLRASAMGYKPDEPLAEEMKDIEKALAESLSQGALGMSAGLAYPPACYSRKDELLKCAKMLADAGGFFACHIRSEGRGLVEAIKEVKEIAEETGVRLEVSHLKTSGRENWVKLDQVFEIVESAQKRGVKICADRYPYLAAFTGLSSILPDWVFAGTREEYLSRLRDESLREKIRQDVLELHPDPEYLARVVIAEVFEPERRHLEGMSLAEAARKSGMDPLDLALKILARDFEGPTAVYHTMSEDNLFRILEKDWVMIGSDSAVRAREGVLSKGKPHPRGFGTFPRIIAYAVREKGVLSLEDAIKKMTSDPCGMAGIKERGRIRKGFLADLVLFDPERIQDLATYEEPHQYPVGIEMVVVNGRIAAEKGKLKKDRAGRILRRWGG
jgi:N-acyl-D-amino-acid deacylase